jgi:hypothetical protein
MRRSTEIVLVNAMPNGNLLQFVSHDQDPLGALAGTSRVTMPNGPANNLAPPSQIIGAK